MSRSNKRRKIQKVNEKMMIVSIDIGKEKNTCSCRCITGFQEKVFSFTNDLEGFTKLWKKICIFKALHKLDKVMVGFESTGSYWEPLAHYLKEKPVKLVQVNPMHTKRLKDMRGNSKTKTDEKDPFVIGDIIQLGNYLSVIIPKGASAHLRRLIHSRERELEKRNVSINQLYDLLFLIFPEFLQVMKGIRTKSSFFLLDHYPSPEHILELGYEELFLLLKKISRGKLGFERVEELLEAARNSVGIKEGKASIILEIKNIIREIKLYNEFIEKIEKDVTFYLKKIPYSSHILSIKGVAEITAAGLIGEVGDFESIRDQYCLLKLAGLNLCPNSSCKRKGQICISKQGRALMRKILYYAALNTIRKDGIMHEYYRNLIERGKLKMYAIVAVMRKLLKLIFALVREKTDYNVNYGIKLAA